MNTMLVKSVLLLLKVIFGFGAFGFGFALVLYVFMVVVGSRLAPAKLKVTICVVLQLLYTNVGML